MQWLQRFIWLLSTLVNSENNGAMPEFTKVKYQNEQLPQRFII